MAVVNWSLLLKIKYENVFQFRGSKYLYNFMWIYRVVWLLEESYII